MILIHGCILETELKGMRGARAGSNRPLHIVLSRSLRLNRLPLLVLYRYRRKLRLLTARDHLHLGNLQRQVEHVRWCDLVYFLLLLGSTLYNRLIFIVNLVTDQWLIALILRLGCLFFKQLIFFDYLGGEVVQLPPLIIKSLLLPVVLAFL